MFACVIVFWVWIKCVEEEEEEKEVEEEEEEEEEEGGAMGGGGGGSRLRESNRETTCTQGRRKGTPITLPAPVLLPTAHKAQVFRVSRTYWSM